MIISPIFYFIKHFLPVHRKNEVLDKQAPSN